MIADNAAPLSTLIRDLGVGMGTLFLVVKCFGPLIAGLFTDQRERLAAADAAIAERLMRSEQEVVRLNLELVEAIRGEAQAKARAADAERDLMEALDARDAALSEAASANKQALSAEAKAETLQVQLDSRTTDR